MVDTVQNPIVTGAKRDTRFKPGNPGPPKGFHTGRTKLLKTLDGVMSSPNYRKILAKWVRAEIRRDPRYAWEKIILPLLPKDVRLDVTADGLPSWVVNVFQGDVGANQPDSKAVEGVGGVSRKSLPSQTPL